MHLAHPLVHGLLLTNKLGDNRRNGADFGIATRGVHLLTSASRRLSAAFISAIICACIFIMSCMFDGA